MTTRRGFQFGLKAMFGVFVLLAVLLWWLRSPHTFTVQKVAHWTSSSRGDDGATHLIEISWWENPISHTPAYHRNVPMPAIVHFYDFDEPPNRLSKTGVEHIFAQHPSEELTSFRSRFPWDSVHEKHLGTAFWHSHWGDPIATMNAFTADESVEEWTSESFLKWIEARKELGDSLG